MFEQLKNLFNSERSESRNAPAVSAVSQWAETQGLSYSGSANGRRFVLSGTTGQRPLRLELGAPTRDFIHGEELLGRAELKINVDTAVFILSRSLKEALEARAYGVYTDTLHTRDEPSLLEEMRWFALYRGMRWDGLPKLFWDRYSVIADQPEHAQDWVRPELADLLMSWPVADSSRPFIMMLLRGKAYLRMQHSADDLPTLAHATEAFRKACESAVAKFSTDIAC